MNIEMWIGVIILAIVATFFAAQWWNRRKKPASDAPSAAPAPSIAHIPFPPPPSPAPPVASDAATVSSSVGTQPASAGSAAPAASEPAAPSAGGGGATPARTTMRDSYPTAQAIQSDADAIAFGNQITVDGEKIHEGFGPPLAFYRQPDGSFATTKPAPTPAPAPAPSPTPAPAPAPRAQPPMPPMPSAPGDFASYLLPPPMPAPNGGAISYPVAALTDADKFFLYRMDYWYKGALAHIPGSHQLHRDLLTDSQGHTVWQGAPIDGAINQAINFAGEDHAAEAQRFDVKAYAGPLAQIYSNLVAAKRG